MAALTKKKLKSIIEHKTDLSVVCIVDLGSNHLRIWLERNGLVRSIIASGTSHDGGRARHNIVAEARRVFKPGGKV